jgi:glutaredoxin
MEAMMKKATFYHAGCSVCVEAEQQFADALDPQLYEVEVVHLGEDRSRLDEAEGFGVKSVPALVVDGVPFHINHGADLSALR